MNPIGVHDMKINLPLVMHEMPPTLDHAYWKKYSPAYARLKHELSIRLYMRTRLAEAQNWRCCWCGCDATPMRNKANSATTEHVLPRSKGGSDDWENLAMACERCNTRRGSQDADDFLNKRPSRDKPEGAKQSTKETQRLARERRYRKRAAEFELNGWKNSLGEQYSFSEWISTLTRAMSVECLNELTEKYGNKELVSC